MFILHPNKNSFFNWILFVKRIGRFEIGWWKINCFLITLGFLLWYNKKAQITKHNEFGYKKGVGEFLDAREVLKLESQEAYLKMTAGTSLVRPKLANLRRNAEIVLKNEKRETNSQ